MIDNPFFIRLESKKAINDDLIKEWIKDLKETLSISVFAFVTKVLNDGSEKRGYVSHRTTNQGSHVYEIPLVRDLSQMEKDLVAKSTEWIIKATKSYLTFNGKGLTSLDPLSEYSSHYKQLCVDIAKMMHQKWYSEKSEEGWKYGLTFSMKEKTHPMMRPWEDLPETYRKVDYEIPKELINIFGKNGFVMINKFDLDNLINK